MVRQMYSNMTRRSKVISSCILVGMIVGIVFLGQFLWEEYIDPEEDDTLFDKTVEDVFNPAAQMMCSFSTDTFIQYYGYEVEVHYVTTEDGYVLTVYRCWSKEYGGKKRKPVILQHGIQSTSDVFVMNPGNQSLAFFMADAGYDVWLPNSRGTTYSRRHVRISPDDPYSGYWNFTWVEMGLYDQSAVIDYVLMRTASKTLNFVGHSQGTTSLLVLLSMKPDYNDKIDIASLMAPIAYLKHVPDVQRKYFSSFLLLWPVKDTEFRPHSSFQERLNKILCPGEDISGICGFQISDDQRNRSMELVYQCRTTGVSVNQGIHYGQLTAFKYFGEFMHDLTYPINNQTVTVPKDFPLGKIRTRLTLHYSLGDVTTNPADIAELQSRIGNIVHLQVVKDDTFSHSDFALGISANEIVYANILKTWQKF